MKQPLDVVTAIVINWNTRNDLDRCINSFLQEGLARSNVVVVDQGSRDGSASMLRRKYRGVRILVGDNRGYGAAVNTALKIVRTPYFIVSNADIIVQRGCIARLVTALSENERLGILGPRVYDANGKKVTRFSRTSVTRAILLEIIPRRLRGHWRDFEQRRDKGRGAFSVAYVEGAFMAIRRKAFEEIGGFDEGLTFFFEDADLPLRMLKAGWDVYHVPTASITHIGAASFSKVPLKRDVDFQANILRLYRRHALRKAVLLRSMYRLLLFKKALWYRILPIGDERRNAERLRIKTLRQLHQMQMPRGFLGDQPFVSVVVPTVNRPDSLARLVQSLKRQSYTHWEVVVVDQSDGRRTKKPTKVGAKSFKTIFVDRKDRALAKNIGLTHARGDVILFCDDDIVVPHDFIETHARMHLDPSVGGVSCRVMEDGLEPLTSQNICRVTPYGKMIAGFQSDVTCNVETLVGANMSIKKTALQEAGYFDSSFRGTGIFEEPDLSERLRNAGYTIKFTNHASIRHHPQPDGNLSARVANPVGYYRDFHHNEIIFFLKNRNHLLLAFVVPFCMLRSIRQTMKYRLPAQDILRMFSGVFQGWHTYRKYTR